MSQQEILTTEAEQKLLDLTFEYWQAGQRFNGHGEFAIEKPETRCTCHRCGYLAWYMTASVLSMQASALGFAIESSRQHVFGANPWKQYMQSHWERVRRDVDIAHAIADKHWRAIEGDKTPPVLTLHQNGRVDVNAVPNTVKLVV